MCLDKDFQMFGLKLNSYDLFPPLEVVGRGQLQVGENWNYLI